MNDEPLYPRLRAAISNAYYGARNDGRTMEQAADDAAAACEEVVKREEPLRELLDEAYELLDHARYDGTDPGLARSWGRRRKRFRDAVLDRRL